MGATLYHSAFGFASVKGAEDDAVLLTWERDGTHLPERVKFDALRRVYAVCEPDGFFHRALHQREALTETVHTRPADAIAWLLADLGAPQKLRDVMDWFVGRGLFTPKTFVRWWGTAEALLKSDARLSWQGEWVQLRSEDPTGPEDSRLVQLEPHLVDSEAEEEPDSTFPPEDFGTDEHAEGTQPVYTPAEPTSLAELALPQHAFLRVAVALAEALAEAHEDGRIVSPYTQGCVLRPDGTVEIHQGEPRESGRIVSASRDEDVRAAAVVLLETFLGRHLPHGIDPATVLPYVRNRLPDLPPSALAPMYEALHPNPGRRPSAGGWLAAWRDIVAVEAEREVAYRSEMIPRVGYDSHIGRVKLMQTQVNQDAIWVGMRDNRALFVLCDGISVADAGRGDIASRLGTQAIARMWEHVPPEQVPERRLLDHALQLANQAICDRTLRAANNDLTNRMPMGTTVLAAITKGNRVHLSWLGDSRAYLVGDFGISQLTCDHNVSGERLLAWCDHRARGWDPNGHALVRYLGHFDGNWKSSPFPAHHLEMVLRPGEMLVLCSDGITDYIASHQCEVALLLSETARLSDPDEACRALVGLANRRGGGDNASVIVIKAPRHQRDGQRW